MVKHKLYVGNNFGEVNVSFFTVSVLGCNTGSGLEREKGVPSLDFVDRKVEQGDKRIICGTAKQNDSLE